MKSFNRKERQRYQALLTETRDKTVTRIVIMTAAGCLSVLLTGINPQSGLEESGTATSASAASTVEAATTASTVEAATAASTVQAASAAPGGGQPSSSFIGAGLADRPSSYRPSVLKYNLMALSPEQGPPVWDDTISVHNFKAKFEELYRIAAARLHLPYGKSAQNTFGGIFYEDLNRKDAEWIAQLYKWLQYTPPQAADRLGLPLTAVEGSYDPANPEEESGDPSTWLIPSWNNIKIQFCDGDGRPASLSSNAKAIAAMASVYTYYTGWDDAAAFKAYADQLWNASHSYTVSISDVYYCEGCTEAAEAPLEGPLGANGNISPETLQSPEEPASEAQKEKTAAAGPAETGETSEAGAVAAAGKEETADEEGAADEGAADGETSAAGEETAADGRAAAGEETAADRSAAAGEETAADRSAAAGEETAADGSAAAGEEMVTDGGAQENTLPSGEAGEGTHPASDADALSEKAAAGQETSAQPQLNEEGKFCPGHVDLVITIKINGLTERNNLFTLDAARGRSDGRGWPGWTGYTKAYVKQLYAQDWQKEYGLPLVTLAFGTPLTSAQITSYMNLLPADTSDERKALIAYALSSVGKIPYYYGGKAKTSGYEGNQFYAPVPPDKKGRILSGLDCSGWINWVYWSVTGVEPTVYGTTGLSQAGHEISRDALQPGDIIVKPGTDSHVMMFLGWTDHHSMICVHETGGNINNVIVSDVNVNWPFYRSLVD